MNKSFKNIAIATSLILGYLLATVAAEGHSHTARATFSAPAFSGTEQNAEAFMALAGRPWNVQYSVPDQPPSCTGGCAPLMIYGISF